MIETVSSPTSALVSLSNLVTEIQGPEDRELTNSEEIALQLVNAARWQLENAKTLDEAKNIHDALRRFQIEAEQRKMTLFATNALVAQRIRTEWRMGKALSEMPRENGGRGNVSTDGKSFLETIANAGIDKSSAYRWQDIAKIDPQDLELYFEEMQGKGEELSTNGVLNWFSKIVDANADTDTENDSDEDDENEQDNEPTVKIVSIACKSCGAIHEYEV